MAGYRINRDLFPEGVYDMAREAWAASWPLHVLADHPRFTHAQAVGRTNAQEGGKTVHWLLLDRDRVIHSASVQDVSPSSPDGALAAAESAKPFRLSAGKPQFCLLAPTGSANLGGTFRSELAIRLNGHAGIHYSPNLASWIEHDLFSDHMERNFLPLLDQAAVESAKALAKKSGSVRAPGIPAYNTFAGVGADGYADRAGEWRRQAAKAYPVFARGIRDLPEMASAIDASSPLVASIARIHGMSAPTVRAMAGWPFGEKAIPARLAWTCQVADSAPPDWLPRDPEGWTALRQFGQTLRDMGVFSMLSRASDQGRPALAPEAFAPGRDACKRLMKDVLRRNGRRWNAAFEDAPHLRASVGHLPDTGLSFCFEVLLPAMAARGLTHLEASPLGLRSDLRELGADILVAGRSPRQALRVARAHMGRHLAAGEAVPKGEQSWWFPLGDDAEAPNGFRIVNLCTSEELRREGQVMGHCVASYGWACSSGQSRILAVRDAGGRPVSTVEVRVPVAARPQIVQHKAHGNRAPSSQAQEAARWYVEALSKGDIQGNQKQLSALAARSDMSHRHMDAARGLAPLLDHASGYDWTLAEAREATWKAWSGLLDEKRRSLEDWLGSLSQDLVLAGPGVPVRAALAEFLLSSQDSTGTPVG